MAFADNLRPASLGGVPFFVERHDHETGRRTATHVYPFQDTPYVEDLGRKPRTWSIAGHIIADDFKVRDRLLERLERSSPAGSGERRGEQGAVLVHPYMGIRRVFVTGFRLTESTREGRISRFELQCTEIGEQIYPFRARSGPSLVDSDADSLDAAAQASVADRLDAVGPQEVRTSMSTELAKLGNTLAGLDVFTGPTADVAAIAQSIRALTVNASALVTSPADLAAEVVSAVAQARAAAGNAVDALAAYEVLFELTPDLLTGSSATVVQANENATAVNALTRIAAISGAGRAMARIDWEARRDAIEARERTLSVLDELAPDQPDELWVSMNALRSTIAQSVPPRGTQLPRVGSYTPAQTIPSVVLAYRLYADPERGDQIVDRNAVKHPGFIPGGQALEVIVNA